MGYVQSIIARFQSPASDALREQKGARLIAPKGMPESGDNRGLPTVIEKMPMNEGKRVGRRGFAVLAFSETANDLGIGRPGA